MLQAQAMIRAREGANGFGTHIEEVGHPEDALSLGLEELDSALEGTLLVGDHREGI